MLGTITSSLGGPKHLTTEVQAEPNNDVGRCFDTARLSELELLTANMVFSKQGHMGITGRILAALVQVESLNVGFHCPNFEQCGSLYSGSPV